ncbi:MAG TPA: glutamine--fructose-6-phosphate transaminase (isomerizing) [Thermoanaerobaculia bacterium]|nr:glutamine--fructose-6-phosphate transaminase (isomerizing) [Thermoanaerobaculia bacterium]HUM30289.1 glutamine--fructose-6-phosphate transaminase (isomerizing) [Thermoanaerobaculia bacterium]HXK68415.1 glutamine--fructose-6-phosphate transaminase (isomerizing) [Thermoanaerobaculia bacterium]
MCGIVGYTGPRNAVPIILEGLHRLEYRGYDSSGIALIDSGTLKIYRKPGKIVVLEEELSHVSSIALTGIGHTRWATHGKPTEDNAHPHRDCTNSIAVIHNGIIENYRELRDALLEGDHTFTSDTDTEVIAHLIEDGNHDSPPLQALRSALTRLQGYYALAVLFTGEPETIYATRKGAPLILGLGEGESFLASDYTALLNYTRDVIILEDGDIARISPEGIELWDAAGNKIEREVKRLAWDPIQIEKSGFRHFMLKEINEQPIAVRDTLQAYLTPDHGDISLPDFDGFEEIRRVQILACGTSWHAGLVGKFYFEQLAGIHVDVDYSSEYRYRDPIVTPETLILGISQSGETTDTVAAMQLAKERGARLVSICNVMGSQIARMSESVLYTHAGPEIGVASTKAFTTQLLSIYLLALKFRQSRGLEVRSFMEDLPLLPQIMEQVIEVDAICQDLARTFHRTGDFLYLGRGVNYPIALEGALKLKEISYIHAEGYPAGEMKHGPIALIDDTMPVVVLATPGPHHSKIMANIEEVKARDGIVIGISAREDDRLSSLCDHTVHVPTLDPLLQPMINVVPLQLFAYHTAVRRGCDVDQPRNLAKSVTVE